MASRRPVLAVIGRGDQIPAQVEATAESVGRLAIEAGFRIVTGGLGGVMGAASRGAHTAKTYREGDVVGILPGESADDANEFIDIAIPTGLEVARNVLVVRAADVVIAVGGAAGTLSEIAFGWQLGKPIIALTGVGGWSDKLAGDALDDRARAPIVEASTPEAAIKAARQAVGKFRR